MSDISNRYAVSLNVPLSAVSSCSNMLIPMPECCIAVGPEAVLAGRLHQHQRPVANIKRLFASFSQAARESADSRIYAGIHFRSACEDGLVLGRKIGQRVVASYLQPLRN